VFAAVVSGPAAHYAPRCIGFDVRIHTGGKSWTVRNVQTRRSGIVSDRPDGRVFAGEVDGPLTAFGATYMAVVVMAPAGFAPAGQPLAVWAEVETQGGSRFRIGSPFVAALLARDPALVRIYHRASPEEDQALLTVPVRGGIADMAAAGGIVDSGAHARRMAAILLPDVIEYRQDRPAGFTFASQNGCHPADDVGGVVMTVLTGAAARPSSPARFPSTGSFPYLVQPAAA